MERAMIDLTPTQRLALYEYCMEVSKSSADMPGRVTDDDDLLLLGGEAGSTGASAFEYT